MTDKLSVGSTLSGERAVSIEVTQREAIARIIAPEWWSDDDRDPALNNYPEQHRKYQAASLAKADAILALHAAPLREALKPFAAFPLSTEGEVSDCVLRTPAAEARRHADAIENRDAQIIAARAALSPSYPMENNNGE